MVDMVRSTRQSFYEKYCYSVAEMVSKIIVADQSSNLIVMI